MQAIHSVVSRLQIGEPQVFADLAVFPLCNPAGEAMGYVLLDEALENKLARVTEVSEAGHVPELAFENDSPKRVLLVDGDELLGARQNRIVNITILVGAGKKLVIPVSCVEQGRWSYRSRGFEGAKRSLFASAKARKMRDVSESLRDCGSRESDQSAVWGAIRHRLDRSAVRSETLSMADLYTGVEKDLSGYESAFPLQPGQAGAVFASGGRVLGLELFDAPEAFARCFSKIVFSYAMDAKGSPEKVDAAATLEDVRRFLDEMTKAATEKYPALGEGEELRFSTQDIEAGALVADGRLVHLAADKVSAPATYTWRRRFGELQPSDVKRAIDLVMSDTSSRMLRLWGTAGTAEMAAAIARRIERES
jgi:hypothetical protein